MTNWMDHFWELGMVRRGYVENGMIRPIGNLDLPEGAEVNFEPVVGSPSGIGEKRGPQAFDAQVFWDTPAIERLAASQRAIPPTSLDDLAGDWPAEDSLDEFLELVHQGRA